MSTPLAMVSGLLLAASFPKFGHPVFAWIALAPLVVAVGLVAGDSGRGPARAFRLGAICGLTFFAGAIYWVVGVMHTYGGLAMPVAVLVGLLLVSYLALYPGLFALALWWVVRRMGVAGVWLAPSFWVSTEWLRSTVGGGFPWVLLGSSQSAVTPVAQAASVVGVYGLSALVALVGTAAAAVALSPRRPHRIGAMAVGALLVFVAVAGMLRVRAGTWTSGGSPLRVGLVQGSVNQEDKHDVRLRDTILGRYLNLSRQVIESGAELVVWPEAATPFIFNLQADFAAPVRRLAVEARTPFLIGTDEIDLAAGGAPDRYYNAAVLVGDDGRSKGSYRKMQLVPFGEYVPLKSLLFFVGPLIEAVSDFSAGTTPVVFDAGGRRVSVAICYESIYPSIARAFVAGGSQLLVTITNDAWFQRSSAAYQHFDQGALRAVEQGRYVVRAANTGISGAVDPYGRVLARTDLFVPAAIAVDVRLVSARTIYSAIGDVVVWVSLAVSVLILIVLRGRPPDGASARHRPRRRSGARP